MACWRTQRTNGADFKLYAKGCTLEPLRPYPRSRLDAVVRRWPAYEPVLQPSASDKRRAGMRKASPHLALTGQAGSRQPAAATAHQALPGADAHRNGEPRRLAAPLRLRRPPSIALGRRIRYLARRWSTSLDLTIFGTGLHRIFSCRTLQASFGGAAREAVRSGGRVRPPKESKRVRIL